MTDSPLMAFAGLALACGVCQWLAWRFKLPSILFLLLTGIVAGPLTGLFNPDKFLGDLLFPFVSVAVAIILFEGGLTLKLSDIRGHGSVVTRLITLGVLVTWLMLTVVTMEIFGLSWQIALIFGSICVVSGPTVIKPLLRTVRPSARVGSLLNWEGILIDPLGVFLALLVFDFVLLEQPGSGALHIGLILAKLVVIGTAFGVAAGYATAFALRRYLVPDYLVNVLTLATVILVFVVAETLQHESGLLAVTIMGIWLANTRGLHIEEILNFKEDLSVLLISGLFVVLAARLEVGLIPQYGWQILLLLIATQFLIRPISVLLCTVGSELNWRERAFIAWIAPRGIVAAAISSLFALRLEENGVSDVELLVPLTFCLIIGTVVFQSITAKPLAKRLGISNPEPNGVLFFGANELAVPLAEALRKESINVMLADTSWRHVRAARNGGFEAYHGNPTSGHAAENLNLNGIGKLIAISDNRDTNSLTSMHFRREFGTNNVFTLRGASEDDAYERFDTANRNRGNPLFDASINYESLKKRLANGEIRHLTLVEASDADDKQRMTEETDDAVDTPGEEYEGTRVNASNDNNESCTVGDDDLRLFALNTEGQLYIYGAGEAFIPKPGWRIIVLSKKPETDS